jgi:hypothetical protein
MIRAVKTRTLTHTLLPYPSHSILDRSLFILVVKVRSSNPNQQRELDDFSESWVSSEA